MPAIFIAESLARALGQPIKVSRSGRVICGEGFQIDICAAKISAIVKGEEDILSAMSALFGLPEKSRSHVFGVSEYVFSGTILHPSPPNGKKFLWADAGNGWEEVRYIDPKASIDSATILSAA